VYEIRPDSEAITIIAHHNLTGIWKNETIKAGVIRQTEQLRVNIVGNVGLVPPTYVAIRRKHSREGVNEWYGCEGIFDKSELCRSTHWNQVDKLVDNKCVQPKWTIWPGRTEFNWKRIQFKGVLSKFRKLINTNQLQIQRGSSVLMEFPIQYATVTLEAKQEILTKNTRMCDQVQRVSTAVEMLTVDDSYQKVKLRGFSDGTCRINVYVAPCILLGDVSMIVSDGFVIDIRVSCGLLLPNTFKIEYDKHAYIQVPVSGLKRNWTAAWQSTYAVMNLTEALVEKYVDGFNINALSKITNFLNFDIMSVFTGLGTKLVYYLACAVFV
jgi:hypothetical protein